MNGYSTGRNPFQNETGRPSPSPPRPSGPASGPNRKMLVEGYRKDILNNFEREAPRYNPMNADRPQSSALVDLKDPIQVHLLTETALSDSRKFEILSQEEVDELKKQIQSFGQRIEQTRANLSLQSKYRDAAISMAKLYAPGGKRRSLLGNRNSGGDGAREAEAERQACEKRCEELAEELWGLEKRIMDPQRRLLEHTAGILQLTHKASKRPAPLANGQMPNGMPGSPESLYTYSNSRSSIEPPGDDSFMDSFQERPRKNAIEIPLKSPVREQNAKLREQGDQLRGENNKLRDESLQLRAQSDALSLELEALQRENSQRLKSITDIERKLDGLNNKVREVIIKFNPTKNANYRTPPYGLANGSDRAVDPGDMLPSQLDYLAKGLSMIRQEQELQASESMREADAAAAAAAVEMAQAEGRIEAMNRQIRDLLDSVNASQPPPPASSGSDLQDQIGYLQKSLSVVEAELQKAVEDANTAKTKNQASPEIDMALKRMWNTIQAGYEDIQRGKEQRRKNRQDKGPTEEDDSADEALNPDESFSVQALSTRVRAMSSRLTRLLDEKSVLQRQIKQQRELNANSDTATKLKQREDELRTKDTELQSKDGELRKLKAELDEMKMIVERSQADASQTQGMLLSALRDLDVANKKSSTEESEAVRSAREELLEKSTKLAALEKSSKDLESRLNMTETSRQELQTKMTDIDSKIESLEKQLVEASAAKRAAEMAAEYKQKELDGKQKEVKEKDDLVESMNLMVVELKTELTIARAELDGAYGSRAERAADVAALKSSEAVVQLKDEVDNLKSELAQTLKQLEDITRETIDAEREKLEVEGKLDDAVANKAALETEVQELRNKLDSEILSSREKIAKLQEDLDNERLKVVPGGDGAGAARPGAGASMLSEQFRATMREERKKFQEDLREEQARRRKLEEELTKLKKAQGPGRSPLSPR